MAGRVKFKSRQDAGMQLGEALKSLELDPEATTILGLVRGGAVVACEAAAACGLNWDIFIVRKIGAPSQPEYAIGAVCENGQYMVNRTVLPEFHLDDTWVEHAVKLGISQCRDLHLELREAAPAPEFHGRQIVLVDDGMATGLSMLTAIEGIRRAGASRIVVGMPVLAIDALAALNDTGVEVCYLSAPPDFRAVGLHYLDFSPVSTAQVKLLLASR